MKKISIEVNVLNFKICILLTGILFALGCAKKEASALSISIDNDSYLLIKNNTDNSIAFNKPIRMQNKDYINLFDKNFNKNKNFAFIYLLNEKGEKIFACGSLHFWGKQTEVIIPNSSIYKDDIYYGGPSIKELYCLEPGSYRMILEIGEIQDSIELDGLKTVYKSNYLDITIK